MADGTLQLTMNYLKALVAKKWPPRLGISIVAIFVAVSGCHRAYHEFVASDSVSDIFYDAREPDPEFGFKLLHARWKSFQPMILPNTGDMRSARLLSGCCLLIRFWNRLSDSDRRQIIDASRNEPLDTDYERELKQLMQTRIQIQLHQRTSISKERRAQWDQLNANFGYTSKP